MVDKLSAAEARIALIAMQEKLDAISARRAKVRELALAGPQPIAFEAKAYKDKMLVTFAIRNFAFGEILIEAAHWDPERFLQFIEVMAPSVADGLKEIEDGTTQ